MTQPNCSRALLMATRLAVGATRVVQRTQPSSVAQKLVATIITATSLSAAYGCDGCKPVTLRSIDLKPTGLFTGLSGKTGSTGTCLGAGSSPPSPFAAAGNQVMVGFDNFFKAGSGPLPCDDIRAAVFRGNVRFDLIVLDVPDTATLSFSSVKSVTRSNAETLSNSPGISFGTTLGVASQPSTSTMPETNLAPLTAGPNIRLTVTGQVKDWLDKAVPNFGFVIGGPTGLVDVNNPPENNDAKLTWYQDFNLQVVYNPALNPRAPQ